MGIKINIPLSSAVKNTWACGYQQIQKDQVFKITIYIS